MAYFADLSSETQVASGGRIRAVGWLDDRHDFATGTVAQRIADRLRAFAEQWRSSTDALGWPRIRGMHRCELCRKVQTAGNFGVPANDLLYVAPEMIVHYVEVHRYLPSKAFLDAVVESPLPDTDEYRRMVRKFETVRIA